MHEDLEVHKFGGSCLRDGTDAERIANILLEAEQPAIVVVSALWGTTDRLMRAAQEPRYAGRLVYDLAKHHLRFSPTLVDSPLYDVFQRVLDGIEESLNALATDRDDLRAYNRAPRLWRTPLSLGHRSRPFPPRTGRPPGQRKTSDCNSTVLERRQGWTSRRPKPN